MLNTKIFLGSLLKLTLILLILSKVYLNFLNKIFLISQISLLWLICINSLSLVDLPIKMFSKETSTLNLKITGVRFWTWVVCSFLTIQQDRRLLILTKCTFFPTTNRERAGVLTIITESYVFLIQEHHSRCFQLYHTMK